MVVDTFGMIRFEALVGWVMMEKGFQLVERTKLGAIADGGSRVLFDDFSQVVAHFLQETSVMGRCFLHEFEFNYITTRSAV